MTHSVLLHPTYVLHTRSYRDTSVILELFTHEYGRISAVARGAKGLRSRFKGLLQPFVPLLASWSGRGELMTLSSAEVHGTPHNLAGEALICGLYLNELLTYLLHRYDAHPYLYEAYQQTLVAFQQNKRSKAEILRIFEQQLLAELGYALQLDQDIQSGSKIDPSKYYFFDPTQGLIPCDTRYVHNTRDLFLGERLLALHAGEYSNEKILQDAKRLLRIALNRLLAGKAIRSRELFY